ncbi:hypothetical protein BOTBODRAFT_207236 [Botryobasidium botryosum FD-172 SS1]|uniref:Uncharacterized protein n=1 Tax=Botryobasidium botryosum (strain FD-172 SS1) TaxID=930990 RepID=A0A067N3K9_BOTB1|nr:hypothetical protein BOTBODRAFT_207236 [Botryobasidium botryosum FD-172 SS1]
MFQPKFYQFMVHEARWTNLDTYSVPPGPGPTQSSQNGPPTTREPFIHEEESMHSLLF